MSQVKNCPNYSDIINFLADPPAIDDFKGKILELGNCTECKYGVCSLWISCLFVNDFSPQVGLPEFKNIEDLDAYMQKISLDLVMGRTTNQKGHLPVKYLQYTEKHFGNMIPLRAENNNNHIKSNLQKAYDAFHQEDYETAILLFRMLLSDYSKPDELNLYAAISYFFAEDYENAAKFMEYYQEKSFSYDTIKGAAFLDMCSEKMNLNK